MLLSKAIRCSAIDSGRLKRASFSIVLNAGSAEGLSLTAYVLETLSYAITLAYSVKNNFPFSTYGENLFLTIQDILITLLIIAFAPSSSNKPRNLTLALLATAGAAYSIHSLPLSTLALVQFVTLPLSLFSKLPQIAQNARAGSTGQLSAVAVLAQVLGCVARLFTTATEVKDTLVLSGFALALALNLILGSQMWMYWGKAAKSKGAAPTKEKKAVKVEEESEEIVSPQVRAEKVKEEGKSSAYEALGVSPQPVHRFATPPPRSFSPAGSQRKWSRKTVD
ncbi:hypothetical protein NP233_g1156 [Leucocoprinus birnbaumii]|uniref:Mannose-P-dolichol utilization defect 1 protein homolog n=1 Tax=Leucocoprinus birnbaumii TaxID=56174 RepID=A0AAD5W0G2_9AGAR|nr:hypothetical protein NP233_g1156 [Leucocoprinus birnbaumii]